MTWQYKSDTGRMLHDGVYVASGYAGLPPHRNVPKDEAMRAEGPIPRGTWKILAPHDSAHTGPYTMNLEPVGHDAHGRSAFRIHGDSIQHPGYASHGCIILDRITRHKIGESHDTELHVDLDNITNEGE